MFFEEEIKNYICKCSQEICDQKNMINFIEMCHGDVLTRENAIAHMTGSSMIFNKNRTKVLMVYHKIYDSWSWTGGHADGCKDILQVAIKEAQEETGIMQFQVVSDAPVSLDILEVIGHVKRGAYVSAHLHFNLTYVLIADEHAPVYCKPDENTGVMWIAVDELQKYVTEAHMLPIYEKIIERCLKG